MAQITSRKELEAWLKDKPADWGQIIATRAALRVLPTAFGSHVGDVWVRRHAVSLIRALSISWAARNYPAYDMDNAAHAAASAVFSAANVAHRVVGGGPIAEASSAAIGAVARVSAGLTFARASAAAASGAAARTINPLIAWANLSHDCDWLDSRDDQKSASRALTRKQLWPAGEPDGWDKAWHFAADRLRSVDESYGVWMGWYARRIRGERASFGILGDKRRKEDKAVLVRLVDATDENFWDKGATYVNTTLQSWIDEARERVAPSKLTKAEVQVAVVKYASPDARIVDDRFDAGPNATFDKPRYDGDLATLPSQLRAFIGALAASLPRNAPDVIHHCLNAYNDELLVRGTQPIVSIVKGMASAIAAQVWIAPDEADKDNPDAWVLKDPREWEAGTADLFRTFFKAHLDLITHFPLDPEREAMLAATPIDEVAASDNALTDPIDRVTDLIITLAKDGHATENIVRIVKALADYTRDIAGMPKPDEAGLPSTTITPKRRHVLQTAGFYLHAYSILGTTAQLATLPQVQTLMAALAEAAERLMGFIL